MNATWKPHVDTIPLPINIVVDYDKMHEVFERNQLYPCKAKVELTTYTEKQTSIVIQVYEGECRTRDDKCHYLGEFRLTGIPPQPKGVAKINATFSVDSNGILSITACYNCEKKTSGNVMNLDVYTKSGNMDNKTIKELSSLVRKLVLPASTLDRPKCSLLENISNMTKIPPPPNRSNVLKLHVDSEVRFDRAYGLSGNLLNIHF